MKYLFLFLEIAMVIQLFSGCENSTSVDDSSFCDDIEGQYIVVFNEYWQERRTPETAEEVRVFTNQLLIDYEIPQDSVIARFELALRGFTARMDESKADFIQKDSRVDYVEKNRCFQAISLLHVATHEQVTGKS